MGYAFVLFLNSEYTGAYLASIGTFRRYVPRLTKVYIHKQWVWPVDITDGPRVTL